MENKIAYIKTILTASAIFIESYFLTQALMNYFETQGYFSLNFSLLSTIGLLAIALSYTVGLSSPAWGKWSQLIIVPLPFTLGVYLQLFTLEPANALVISLAIFLILAFFVEKSVRLEKLLAKPKPGVFLQPAVKGMLLCISLVAAGIVILNPRNEADQITQNVEDAANNKIMQFLNKSPAMNNREMQTLLEYTSIEENISNEITNQVERAIEPYRDLIDMLMAVFIFLALQGFNAIIFIFYSATIGLIFLLAERTGFIKKEKQMIEKEVLKF